MTQAATVRAAQRKVWQASLTLALIGSTLAGCDNRTQYDKDLEAIQTKLQHDLQKIAQESITEAEQQNREWAASKGPATQGLAVCKAAVGSVMGKRPAGMTGSKIDANRFQVAYRRDDGTRWTYRCTVTADRVRWAIYEDGAEGPLRGDENFRYAVAAGQLRLTSTGMDGKEHTERYSLPHLRPR